MRQHFVLLLLLCVSVCSLSCKGENSNPSAPSAPPTPPSNPGTVVSTNGCSVTYACPNVDASGNANPSIPTFDRLTVTNGTSESCKVDSYRNTVPNPGDNIAIEFTLRNTVPTTPSASFNWQALGGNDGCGMHLTNPQNGMANAPGPFQATVGFGFRCASSTNSGQIFAQNLTLEIRRPGDPSSNPLLAACGVTLWGYITPNK